MAGTFSLEQFLGAGAFAAILSVFTAIIAYRQATRVATTQAQAQIGVRRLENDGALHGFMHDDAKEARKELKEERDAHLKCIEARATAEAEVKRLTECLAEAKQEQEDLEKEVETERHDTKQKMEQWEQKCQLLDIEIRQLNTKLLQLEWLEKNPAMLRAQADLLEQGALQQGAPPTGTPA